MVGLLQGRSLFISLCGRLLLRLPLVERLLLLLRLLLLDQRGGGGEEQRRQWGVPHGMVGVQARSLVLLGGCAASHCGGAAPVSVCSCSQAGRSCGRILGPVSNAT